MKERGELSGRKQVEGGGLLDNFKGHTRIATLPVVWEKTLSEGERLCCWRDTLLFECLFYCFFYVDSC